MDSERWKRIDSLLQEALERPAQERDAFLRSACRGDEELRREVESLLRSQELAGAFLETPAIEVEARQLAVELPSGRERHVGAHGPPPRCRVCSFPIPDGARYCAGCAIPVNPDDRGEAGAVSDPAPLPGNGHLRPGTLIAERYTVLALAGCGGMGDVYRVRDNKLDQVVALKLLAHSLRGNPAALIRLHNEVRVARQISHPNVCRVYDIGEANGLHFLTMEFIDGDDLAHLLRRIGRFPHDKGIEIARRICLALSAAHERGVLHRDLKPGNIMLDAAGHVVVTDFGLAALADDMKYAESRSGTPAYMAPEQAARGKVSVRSDIYSLGLVLYELFTGRPAFEGDERTAITNPASLVKDLHPQVEKTILHCLAEDPDDRPATAIAVAASLPGGDPLNLALAAGQTPPPEMVAASGEKSGISVQSAVWCLVATLAALGGGLILGDRPQVLVRAPIELPPDALAVKARELAASVGYPEHPRASGFGFVYDTAQIRRLEPDGWMRPALSRPAPIRFWYRESPRGLASYELKGVAWDDPPRNLPGMISMQMDGGGRLTFFGVVPIHSQVVARPGEPNWSSLLLAAGLDAGSLRAVAPQIVPPVFADSRLAWSGSYADQPDARVRVEAAALAGRPVYFRLIPSWEESGADPAGLDVGFQLTARPYPPFFSGGTLGLLAALASGAGWVAWRNAKSGRGDRKGAFRAAVWVFVLWTVYGVSNGFGQFADATGRCWIIPAHALFWAGSAWIFYMALEPLVRRSWPHSLVSWSRLLSGRLRDPLVGRDILIGILVMSWFFLLRAQLPITIGSVIPARFGAVIGIIPVSYGISASGTLLVAVAFTLTLVILHRKWAAFALTSTLLFIMNFFLAMPVKDPLQVAGISLYSLLTVSVLMRYGVLACYTAMATSYILFSVPLGPDWDAWYQDDGRICALLLAALAVYGFHSALAGRRVLTV